MMARSRLDIFVFSRIFVRRIIGLISWRSGIFDVVFKRGLVFQVILRLTFCIVAFDMVSGGWVGVEVCVKGALIGWREGLWQSVEGVQRWALEHVV